MVVLNLLTLSLISFSFSLQSSSRLSPQLLATSITTLAVVFLWLVISRCTSAFQLPLSLEVLLFITFLTTKSKALPILSLTSSFLGVWSIESSPINSSELSAESCLKVLTVPFGSGSPSLFSLELENLIMFQALRPYSLYPPVLMLTLQYLSILASLTRGMNSTCFVEDSLMSTFLLRVYMWQSPKVFSVTSIALADSATASLKYLYFMHCLLDTVLTSPAISFTLAFQYFFPLLFSKLTHPAKSIIVSPSFNTKVQSAFQLNPVALQAIQHSEVNGVAFGLSTFQTRVGTVSNPFGNYGSIIPLTSSQI